MSKTVTIILGSMSMIGIWILLYSYQGHFGGVIFSLVMCAVGCLAVPCFYEEIDFNQEELELEDE